MLFLPKRKKVIFLTQTKSSNSFLKAGYISEQCYCLIKLQLISGAMNHVSLMWGEYRYTLPSIPSEYFAVVCIRAVFTCSY